MPKLTTRELTRAVEERSLFDTDRTDTTDECTLDIHNLRAIASLRSSQIIDEDALAHDIITTYINVIQSQSITPAEQTASRFC